MHNSNSTDMGAILIIGLTGGIASGKSSAASYLASLGAVVIDADKLGHEAYEPNNQAFSQVVSAFGDEVVGEDGQINRAALGQKVFGQPAALKQLTDIVWPEIGRLARERINAARAENPQAVVVLEAAVLFEAGWESTVDEVWSVIVDPSVAIARATARDGSNAADVLKRIDAQISNAERRRKSDVVLENEADLQQLHAQLDAQWRRLTTKEQQA